MTRPRPRPNVLRWLDDADDSQLYFSVVSLGEILKGVTILPEGKRRAKNCRIGSMTFCDRWFQGRILPVSEPIAEPLGCVSWSMPFERTADQSRADGPSSRAGLPLSNNLTLVTRNVKDFADLGVTIVQPVGRCLQVSACLPAHFKTGRPRKGGPNAAPYACRSKINGPKGSEGGAVNFRLIVVLVTKVPPDDLIGVRVYANSNGAASEITAFRADVEGNPSVGRVSGFA